jgi:PPOX class probable F420-dependent enzyme
MIEVKNWDLENAKYVSLATFRKSRKVVATPVWAACQDGDYYIFSAGNAGKIKRLRNSSEARLAVCNARGELKGPWHDAQAQILREPEDIALALDALRRKYRVAMWIADVLARLTGRMNRRTYLRVRLTQAASDGI